MEEIDLTPSRLKEEIVATFKVLIQFFKNPILGMQNLPDWNWFKLIFLTGAFAATCGLMSGIVAGQFLAILNGFLAFPLATLIMIGIFSGLFYYIFLFFYARELSYLKIFEHLVFAALPAELLSILAHPIPPMNLLGAGVAFLLLLVGFTSNFGLPRKSLTKLMAGLFLVYVLVWVGNSISFYHQQEELKKLHSPKKAEEILRQEFSQ